MSPPKNAYEARVRLLKRLRKGINKHTRHRVEYAGDGNEKHTCTVCGCVTTMRVVPVGASNKIAEKLAKYRGDASGVLGHRYE